MMLQAWEYPRNVWKHSRLEDTADLWPRNGNLGLKINALGPGGTDLGRLGALGFSSGPRGSSEYLYSILGRRDHWNPLKMAKRAKKWPFGPLNQHFWTWRG